MSNFYKNKKVLITGHTGFKLMVKFIPSFIRLKSLWYIFKSN